MTEKNTLFDLSGLDKEAKILFRRSIGKPLNSVMSRTAHYYYAAESSFGKILNEDLHFAILCLACMYEDLCKWNVSGSATAKNVKRKWIKSIYF